MAPTLLLASVTVARPVLMPVWMLVVAVIVVLIVSGWLIGTLIGTRRDTSRQVGDVPMAPEDLFFTSDHFLRSFTCTSVVLGVLTTNWQATTVT